MSLPNANHENFPEAGKIEAWLKNNPQYSSATAALCDVNGILRGKRLPITQLEKIISGGLRLPASAATLDIWGRDVEDSVLVFETGDADGVCEPTGRGILPCSWMGEPSLLVPVWLKTEDGNPLATDPRQALAAVISRFEEKGLRPVCATELEFYLVDRSSLVPVRPKAPLSGRRLNAESILSIDELDEFSAFLADVYKACREQGIEADAAISESGAGQFEINLLHTDSPLRAADDALLFRHLVKGAARKHGFAATFMSKPFGDSAGSGFHVHFSLLDRSGNNVFDDGGSAGTETLRRAVAGLLSAMAESTLIFAPHQNSYRRIRPGSHAPTGIGWGYENRTAAIRIPGGSPKARRIEHRVAGADANPYLVLAAVLGAALMGIEGEMAPPPPLEGNAYEAGLDQLPTNWSTAIKAFEQGSAIADILAPLMRELFVQTKRQELNRFLQTVTDFEYETYLEAL